MSKDKTGDAGKVDLEEVARIVAKLDHDLANLSSPSQDTQALRDEVDELRRLLHSGAPRESWVVEKLHSIRKNPLLLEALRDGQYVATIGRILGLS